MWQARYGSMPEIYTDWFFVMSINMKQENLPSIPASCVSYFIFASLESFYDSFPMSADYMPWILDNLVKSKGFQAYSTALILIIKHC